MPNSATSSEPDGDLRGQRGPGRQAGRRARRLRRRGAGCCVRPARWAQPSAEQGGGERARAGGRDRDLGRSRRRRRAWRRCGGRQARRDAARHDALRCAHLSLASEIVRATRSYARGTVTSNHVTCQGVRFSRVTERHAKPTTTAADDRRARAARRHDGPQRARAPVARAPAAAGDPRAHRLLRAGAHRPPRADQGPPGGGLQPRGDQAHPRPLTRARPRPRCSTSRARWPSRSATSSPSSSTARELAERWGDQLTPELAERIQKLGFVRAAGRRALRDPQPAAAGACRRSSRSSGSRSTTAVDTTADVKRTPRRSRTRT